MKVFIGSENIISPLGETAETNFAAVKAGKSGIREVAESGYKNQPFFLSKFEKERSFLSLLLACLKGLTIDQDLLTSERTKVIISSTKGAINTKVEHALVDVFNEFVSAVELKNQPLLISNACISGVLAITKGADLIKAGLYDHVVVIGCDVISDFVVYGFESLFALEEGVCKPYDKERKGINLGEGAAGVLLSNAVDSFKKEPLEYISGSSSNDANHISGPSRTGEGLFRTVNKTLKQGDILPKEIDYISAHGTATLYNDDMESIAFSRLGMSEVKLNSLKGYFGHTLGAAGLIEVAIAMQSLRNQILVESKGSTANGTVEPLNVLLKTERTSFSTVLKTASGFGGGNASLIIKKR